MNQTTIFETLPLFEDVQMQHVLPDGKTFVDCIPKFLLQEINKKYIEQKDSPAFDLKTFVLSNFDLPDANNTGYSSDVSKRVTENIEALWTVLTREPNTTISSLITLPYPYIVPGGRFGEIYYWDSYFTMLGLHVSGKTEMIENMINNFSFLIDTLGYIPNGNRNYFIGRSQPPFYSLMIKLLAEIKGDQILQTYLPQLEKEYHFWMCGSNELSASVTSLHRTVLLPDGSVLNRYWDENNTARPESYREDVELSHQTSVDSKRLFRDLRAGAESGWDFSSRWFKDEMSFNTIHTTEIIPVDLNCLLFHLEQTIAKAYHVFENNTEEEKYLNLAEKRKAAIQKYCWNESKGFYIDYDFAAGKQKDSLTLAAAFPLFFNIADATQAKKVADIIKEKFIKSGGVVTTLTKTGQQWDAPNGWAPLQWITIIGLENYGEQELAKEIANKWIQLNTEVFKRTGKLMEKYNVQDTSLDAGGGEYPGQDGFGWTNGVLLALIKKYGA